MSIAICMTMREDELVYLMKSFSNQSINPKEIIVVTGRFSDYCKRFIKHDLKKYKGIKILTHQGSIAECRNLAIELSKGDIIVTTDGGCIPEKDWLEKITYPFKHKNVGIVAGFYTMPYRNPFQQAASVYLGVVPERSDPINFMPSTRSCAFRKSVWEEVGGFNEKLGNSAEDTEFFFRCVKKGVKIARVEEAKVEWSDIKHLTIKKFAQKIFKYAKGDAQANIWWHPNQKFMSHNIKTVTIYLRYSFFLFLTLITLFSKLSPIFLITILTIYLFYPIFKWRDVIQNTKARLWLPIIQIISDIQVMRGFSTGLFKRKTY